MLSQPVKLPFARAAPLTMQYAPQNFPIVRAARLDDAAELAHLTRELLLYEKQLNQTMGELTSWAASAAELRKQMRLAHTKFFLAARGGELVGYVKVVAYGLRLTRKELGWRAWLKEQVMHSVDEMFSSLLRRPRPNFEQVGGFIAGAFVKPEARRSNVGRALVAAAEHWLRQQGLATSELQVLHANAEARRFWESLGYAPLVLGMQKKLRDD
jgi:ribosomal protein S18 acetylase RimI-like enzyme